MCQTLCEYKDIISNTSLCNSSRNVQVVALYRIAPSKRPPLCKRPPPNFDKPMVWEAPPCKRPPVYYAMLRNTLIGRQAIIPYV